ncbi:hypothetical protein PCANC_08441 [Puccinia coronata f. sp. avenae]|uniref:Uncharacterized protein n=1 Tax=Puccinia coronata f. sp. avenae TaxID=200324 RepID=A0A2N5VPP4_9BASI|nr:hypothetical protein PCANC_08441 [Puccinia coronata f. sp. avenae]
MAEASIPKKLLAYDANQLSNHIENDSFDKYQQKSATGFGKSRIPKIYLNMTTKDCNSRHIGVVIVLNPLDALGDNQVTEEIAAIEAIRNCLKLTDKGELHVIRSELSRPKICIVCIPMSHSLHSCEDIAKIYPLAEDTPNNQLVPTLIYSGTCHLTLKVFEVLAAACGTRGDHLNAGSLLGC